MTRRRVPSKISGTIDEDGYEWVAAAQPPSTEMLMVVAIEEEEENRRRKVVSTTVTDRTDTLELSQILGEDLSSISKRKEYK